MTIWLVGTHVTVVRRGCQILVFFAGEYVDGDEVALGVTVLAGLGGGHISDLQKSQERIKQGGAMAMGCK